VPNPWLTIKYAEKLRQYILRKSKISEVVVFDHLVFQKANVYTALIFLEKGNPELKHVISVKQTKCTTDSTSIAETKASNILQSQWQKNEGAKFETRLIGKCGAFVSKIVKRWNPLSKVSRASLGCQAYNSSKHTKEQIRNRVFHSDHKVGAEYLPELAGSDVARYIVDRKKGKWIKYGTWLHDYRTMDWLQGPRILVREIPGPPPYRIQACYIEETYCNYKTILNVNPSGQTIFSMKYLGGLLNSRLLSFLYPYLANKLLTQSFPRLSVGDLRKLPIRTIDFSDSTDKVRHDRMVELVELMIDLHKELAKTTIPQTKTVLQRQIETTDRQIDRLVYELYELTEDEIKIVEGS
jgi:hypothetical protein